MELLEAGPAEPARARPPWLLPAATAVLVLLAAGWWAVTDREATAPPASIAPTAQPLPSPSVAVSRPIESGQSFSAAPAPWPSRAGECGSVAWLPLLNATDGARPEARLLVGGRALTLVDVAAGVARTLWTPPRHGAVDDLLPASGGSGSYVVADGCQPDTAAVWRLRSTTSEIQPVVGALPVPWLIYGQHGPWQAEAPSGLDDASSNGYRLRSVATGDSARLPADAEPVAVTDAGIVTATGSAASNTPRTQVWSTAGRLLRDLGAGWPLGVTPRGEVLATGTECSYGDAGRCRLRLIDPVTGRANHHYELPPGQYVTSGVAFDPTARLAAFTLSRTSSVAHYDTGHPFPSSRIVVLDLATAAMASVPGVELAPKTNAGLAVMSSGWLFATLSFGDRGRVVAWRAGLPAPVHVVDLAGPLTQAPPVQAVAAE